MITIAIDGKLLDPRAGGIGRYSIQLVRSLLASPDPDFGYLVLTGPRTDLGQLAGCGAGWGTCRGWSGSSLVRATLTIPVALRSRRASLYHGMDHVGIAYVRDARTRQVVTIHDVLPLSHPHWYSKRHRWVVRSVLPAAVRRADRIVVPSNWVRRELLRYFPSAAERVVVIPEGVEPYFGEVDDDTPRSVPRADRSRHLLLAVGTHEPRKNLPRLVRALALVRRRTGRGTELVIAGGPGSDSGALAEEVRAQGLDDAVHVTGFVDDAELRRLYRRATLFVHPALAEGFGLPVLEAMAAGTPVICADGTALPETSGDAAVRVDVRSSRAIADAMLALLDDPKRRAALAARGKRNAARFTWCETAAATRRLYRDCHG